MDVLIYVALGAILACLAQVLARRFVGFGAQSPEDYAGQGPDFDIRRHLTGDIASEGVIYGPTGRVAARFVAEMHAEWDGDTGTMTEHFRYDSGTVQDRSWVLKVGPEGAITATAPDLVGEGRGAQKGTGVMLRYAIRLPESSGGHVLQATDWMYLMENGTIINRSEFRKFGFRVAELVATMRPVAAAESERVAAE
ncbi:DUF3833 domain-containing protein [Meridianimarinicoccus sp. RP-17]|uniref:DUF3833 domain-containing protein n=1 Tax=Meridianimarinicoccus zhengii TaxID=2056810 RepID=UPI000DAEB69E|nr:DUF3833 domain-containing protein [Phycocomes zhengii]